MIRNHSFGAIWDSLGPLRGRRPEIDSKPSSWRHTGLPGADPGQEARTLIQTLQLELAFGWSCSPLSKQETEQD